MKNDLAALGLDAVKIAIVANGSDPMRSATPDDVRETEIRRADITIFR